MRILVIHNKYKIRGGEDSCFETETGLLREHGHKVRTLIFDNDVIDSSLITTIKLSYKLFYNSDSAVALEKEIQEFRPQIIHVHNFFYIASPAVFYVAHKHHIPVVLTVHNFRMICAGALLLRDGKVCEKCIHSKFPVDGIIHGCYGGSAMQTAHLTCMTSFHKLAGTWRKKVTRYIVLNNFAKRKLHNSSLGLKSDQIAVKPNCVPDNGYTLPNDREDYFVFVGRLSQEKGIDVLLKARDRFPFKLKIIGTGPLEELVQEYAAKYDDVEYCGFQNSSFITEMLKKSKGLIFPSVWYEGMPITILEAFSTGTPVIASDIDNINEIVENNVNGIHFRLGDSDSLADALKTFNPDIDESQRFLYKQARKTFERKYTREGNYELLMAVYHDVIGSDSEESAGYSTKLAI
ncbi:glycosyltransferase family 4 protein [Pontibacter silvestris]|uniref:Glycosyltransferase family 4 protein n=1 Tax=Pontibacter silvestris TaxID=2305183 RepID=A0ABW4X3R1_9BACT|nr:glycosyltransferase family 4 protein [Pontibacter silvestris]MCC9135059.1 glycosyltransferase family 4 protein [Pontibacter silvestris]